jgi:hypothetical protein
MKKITQDTHILDDMCDCLIEAFGKVSIDGELSLDKLKASLEREIRSKTTLATWMKELIEFDDQRSTKH